MANTFKNASAVIANTSTTIYTTPALTSSIVFTGYFCNNDGTSNVNITLEVEDVSAAVTRKILYNVPVPAGSTLSLDGKINLEPGDIVKATASVNNKIDAFLSVLQIA